MLLAVRLADRAIQSQIRKQTKAIATPEWQRALAENAPAERIQHRVMVSTGRLTASNQTVRISSATVGRRLTGGLEPKSMWWAIEFGASRTKRTTYTATSRLGKTFTVRNRATQNQLPLRRRKGYTFGPAASQMVPRIASLWVQTVVRTIAEAFEGKRGDA